MIGLSTALKPCGVNLLSTPGRLLPSRRLNSRKMVLTLTLEIREGGQERLRFIRWQTLQTQESDERAPLRDVRGTILDVLPDHIEFGLGFAHLGS